MVSAVLLPQAESEGLELPILARKPNSSRRKRGYREMLSIPCLKTGKATSGRHRTMDSTGFGKAHLRLSPSPMQIRPWESWAQEKAASGLSGTTASYALVLAAIMRW